MKHRAFSTQIEFLFNLIASWKWLFHSGTKLIESDKFKILYVFYQERWEKAPFAFKALSHNEIRTEWVRWKRNFEYIVAANGEKDKTRLKFLLLAKAGPEIQDAFENIPGANVEEDVAKSIDPYKTALDKLDEYFAPKHHDSMERNIFWTLNPDSGEQLDKFMLRARE